MLHIKKFTFNPIAVNSFILWDETLECVLIDPACYYKEEQEELKAFIETEKLKPVKLLNTHGHFDHVMGNEFVEKNWGIRSEIHEGDHLLAQKADFQAGNFGIKMNKPPLSGHLLKDGEVVSFGNSQLKVIHVPGHSPGGVAFYSEADGILVAGDILFFRSIGRTDLPMGNYDLLISGINEKLMMLEENTAVYCGHGPETSIGDEKKSNPFLR